MDVKLGEYVIGDMPDNMALIIIEALAGQKNLGVDGSINRTFMGPMYPHVHQLTVKMQIVTLIHDKDGRV